jgi:hypothetical protein
VIEIEPGQTVEVDEDDFATFENHSAFAVICLDHVSTETSAHHRAGHDVNVKTLPVEIDRTNDDDVLRAQEEVLVALSAAVDDHCLRTLLAHGDAQVEDVDPGHLEDWLSVAVTDAFTSSRNDCVADVIMDCELQGFVGRRQPDDHRIFKAGRLTTRLNQMNRWSPVDQGLYLVVAHPHVVPLTARAAIHMSSHTLGRTEFLTASCTFSYAPRIAAHPGSVRMARVPFDSHDAWAQAFSQASLAPTHP